MKLDLLLHKVDVLDIIGDTNIKISNIQLDSRKISNGEMFIALAGTQKSGDEFIKSAIENGAKAIVCHNIPSNYFENVGEILKIRKTWKGVEPSCSARKILQDEPLVAKIGHDTAEKRPRKKGPDGETCKRHIFSQG